MQIISYEAYLKSLNYLTTTSVSTTTKIINLLSKESNIPNWIFYLLIVISIIMLVLLILCYLRNCIVSKIKSQMPKDRWYSKQEKPYLLPLHNIQKELPYLHPIRSVSQNRKEKHQHNQQNIEADFSIPQSSTIYESMDRFYDCHNNKNENEEMKKKMKKREWKKEIDWKNNDWLKRRRLED
jgi:Na+/melibiose symporter-like transporter